MVMTATTKVVSPLAVSTEIDGYTITTEPPVCAGGSGEFPPATRMVVAALLNCSFSGVKSFCEKREIPTENLALHFSGEFEDGVYKTMEFDLSLPPEFPEEYKGSVGRIFETCAVKKIMKNLPTIDIRVQ